MTYPVTANLPFESNNFNTVLLLFIQCLLFLICAILIARSKHKEQIANICNTLSEVILKSKRETEPVFYNSLIVSIQKLLNPKSIMIGEFIKDNTLFSIKATSNSQKTLSGAFLKLDDFALLKAKKGQCFATDCNPVLTNNEQSRSELHFFGVPLINTESDELLGVIIVGYSTENKNVKSIISILKAFASITTLKVENQLIAVRNDLLKSQHYNMIKMEAIESLTVNITHDYNNYFNTIIGYSDLLKKKLSNDFPEDELLSRYTDGVLASVKNAVALTEKLSGFSRRVRYVNIETDMHKLIMDTLDSFRQSAENSNVKIVSHLNANNVIVKGDLKTLQDMLLLLLSNAWESISDGGLIIVSTENRRYIEKQIVGSAKPFEIEPGKYITISICDNGCGIDSRSIEHLFEPFFSAKKSKKRAGFGLALVWGCIKSHNGYIDVSSEPSIGSTFTVYLPLMESK